MFKLYVIQFLLLLICYESSGSPFLYNVANVLSSASGSSSSQQHNENIADLRKIKFSNLAKQEIAPMTNHNEFSFDEDPQANNGVVPSIIQKKVTKLLKKFAFITMFANSGNNPSVTDEDFNSNKDELDGEIDSDFENNNNTGIVNNATINNNASYLFDMDKEDSKNEIILFDQNGRVEAVTRNRIKPEINGDIKSQKQQEGINNKAGFFRFSPNDIGLFFIEALASVAGLAYGLVSQANITLPG